MFRRALQMAGLIMAILSAVSFWIVDAKPSKRGVAAPNLTVSAAGQVAAGSLVHASCVAVDGKGLLILGPSGAGKSALALALIAMGAPIR